MATPNIVFYNYDLTKTLPQSGTSYFDWNATDHAGGASDTPEPLLPNSTGNEQYVRLKNEGTATATYMKFYIDGTDASSLASLNYLRIKQGLAIATITSARGVSYENGITVTMASGTVGNVLSPAGASNTITLYAVTTATGVNANDWSLYVGYYYIP